MISHIKEATYFFVDFFFSKSGPLHIPKLSIDILHAGAKTPSKHASRQINIILLAHTSYSLLRCFILIP